MAKSSTPASLRVPVSSRKKTLELEPDFLLRIAHECLRAERSKRRFVLVLIEGFAGQENRAPYVLTALGAITREIDIAGWYETGATMGVMFAELGDGTVEEACEIVTRRIRETLEEKSDGGEFLVSTHVLPRDVTSNFVGMDDRMRRVYQNFEALGTPHKKSLLLIKRAIDIAGSASLLLLLSPLMALIALMVKLGSQGPVLFRQTRVGLQGKHFTFLKFRSMTVANDASVHEEYVKDFIRGTAQKHINEKGEGVFKLTQDTRVTRVGRILRKTSFDELPQLWNVLVGEMSLVGPRPPIPYEVECYSHWHLRRILESKPGITGLWQIRGRSKTGFDEMVRLDLLYARTWSPWLDLKILLMTPRAVFGGGGAH
jgi:lipopolysaccharide/colanic/teichoic acid biosynthesis glycosyltransferase